MTAQPKQLPANPNITQLTKQATLAGPEELAAAVGSEGDRAVIDGELAREPWFGLK